MKFVSFYVPIKKCNLISFAGYSGKRNPGSSADTHFTLNRNDCLYFISDLMIGTAHLVSFIAFLAVVRNDFGYWSVHWCGLIAVPSTKTFRTSVAFFSDFTDSSEAPWLKKLFQLKVFFFFFSKCQETKSFSKETNSIQAFHALWSWSRETVSGWKNISRF